jgi:hypothetical protein
VNPERREWKWLRCTGGLTMGVTWISLNGFVEEWCPSLDSSTLPMTEFNDEQDNGQEGSSVAEGCKP